MRDNRTASSRIRVRRIVGHSVSRVAHTVRPTNPRTLTAWCASRSRECHVAERSRARIAPNTAPMGRKNAAVAYQRTVSPNRAGRAVRNCASRARPCQVSITPITVAAITVSHHQFASIPTINRAVPAVTP